MIINNSNNIYIRTFQHEQNTKITTIVNDRKKWPNPLLLFGKAIFYSMAYRLENNDKRFFHKPI